MRDENRRKRKTDGHEKKEEQKSIFKRVKCCKAEESTTGLEDK